MSLFKFFLHIKKEDGFFEDLSVNEILKNILI
jgi:hypothetical protein